MNKILAWLTRLASQHLILLALLLSSQWAHAITVDAEIKSGRFRWVSAQSSFGGGVAPSIWETPHGLAQGRGFIPGGGPTSPLPISLLGPNGSAVPFSLKILGMEYVSPEAAGLLDAALADAPLVLGTATTRLSGSLVQVEHGGSGDGLGDKFVFNNIIATPFTHVRPVFSLGDDIMKEFADRAAPPGRYTATLFIPLYFDYFYAGDGASGHIVRRNLTIPLTINIDYTPAILTEVTVVSPTNGVITPRYYTGGAEKRVQGDAIYNGVATGFFSNGLRIKLKASDTYQMREITSEPAPGYIPYSVSCTGCEAAELVIDGAAVSGMATTGTRVPGVNTSSISFSIKVGFNDVALSGLHTGTYHGQFSLLFEPDV
ncbi:hypothetical protein ACK34J_05465 [Aeromonas veronii]